MAIVERYMSGNCEITIMDDYIVKTKEEIEEIWSRTNKIIQDAINAGRIKYPEENKENG